MKKLYSTPKLTSHGDISVITNVTGRPSRFDTLFGPPNGSTPIASANASEDDACLIRPGTKVCL